MQVQIASDVGFKLQVNTATGSYFVSYFGYSRSRPQGHNTCKSNRLHSLQRYFVLAEKIFNPKKFNCHFSNFVLESYGHRFTLIGQVGRGLEAKGGKEIKNNELAKSNFSQFTTAALSTTNKTTPLIAIVLRKSKLRYYDFDT